VLSTHEILRFLVLPAAMAAFILASHLSAGLMLRTADTAQAVTLR